MSKARYFGICSIVFLYLFLIIGCQSEVSSNPRPENQEESIQDISDLETVIEKAEVSLIKSNPPINEDIEIKADDVLGQFMTRFASSSKQRKQNIRNAVSKINQTIVYPNEEFSISKLLTPFTEENGYLPAGTIVQGKVVNSYGGGVCQVSSTLYNAVLDAELLVLERHSHSITVSYVEIGRDAAIAENLKDFRFLNSLEVPILIEAIASDRDELIFRIRGAQTKPTQERAVSYEAVIIEEIEAGEPIVEYDYTLPKDYIKITQSAHNGYKVELYRVITINGVEVERIRVNYSEYQASPQYMVIGSKEL